MTRSSQRISVFYGAIGERVTFTTKELSPETWGDFDRLFAPGTGWAFCACMFFQRGRHLPQTEFPGREAMRVQNRAEKRALVDQGRAHGILVYENGEPVGWCQYGPLEELPIPGRRRVSRRIPSAGAGVQWRITCFVTQIRRRRRGVATVALRAALAAIRKRGGGIVEAYPQVTLGRGDYDHGGTISMFEREGFTAVARPDAHSVVMQRRA
jgi:GNAT superfamily N-acetyltransferase